MFAFKGISEHINSYDYCRKYSRGGQLLMLKIKQKNNVRPTEQFSDMEVFQDSTSSVLVL